MRQRLKPTTLQSVSFDIGRIPSPPTRPGALGRHCCYCISPPNSTPALLEHECCPLAERPRTRSACSGAIEAGCVVEGRARSGRLRPSSPSIVRRHGYGWNQVQAWGQDAGRGIAAVTFSLRIWPRLGLCTRAFGRSSRTTTRRSVHETLVNLLKTPPRSFEPSNGFPSRGPGRGNPVPAIVEVEDVDRTRLRTSSKHEFAWGCGTASLVHQPELHGCWLIAGHVTPRV